MNKENKVYKTYVKKVSTLSKTTINTNENNEIINPKIKKHISFKENFLTIIYVESWKDLNFDVSEIDPEWEKVESIQIKNEKNKNNSINKSNFNKDKFKQKKNYCDCVVLFFHYYYYRLLLLLLLKLKIFFFHIFYLQCVLNLDYHLTFFYFFTKKIVFNFEIIFYVL